jgi:hypothetical protein
MPMIESAPRWGLGPGGGAARAAPANAGVDPLTPGIRLRFCYISRVMRDLYNKIERWAGGWEPGPAWSW